MSTEQTQNATGGDAESYWQGLSARERLLFDLIQTGVTAALGEDEGRANRIILRAWQSADRLQPQSQTDDE